MKVLCYPTLPEFSKEHCFLEGSHILRRCPSGEINMQMKMSVERWWNDTERGNRSTGRETCQSATLSTTDLICTVLGSNVNLRGKRPVTDCVSHGRPTGDRPPEPWHATLLCVDGQLFLRLHINVRSARYCSGSNNFSKCRDIKCPGTRSGRPNVTS